MLDSKETTSKTHKPLLLIIAYKRFDNVKRILEIANEAEVSQVLIHVDKATDGDISTSERQSKFCREIKEWGLHTDIEVILTKQNVGCAVNVLQGIDSAFERSEFCYILEDDCIPTLDFFEFASLSQSILNTDNEIWLTCGTQLASDSLTKGRTIRSNYALTWGWYTDRKNWIEIRNLLLADASGEWPGVTLQERVYWSSGCRRAKSGITDVWDTILVSRMRELGKKSLLPPVCLIKNIGDDSLATHTSKGSLWVNQETGAFESPIILADVIDCQQVDNWLRSYVFNISYRHFLSTLVTKILDFFRFRRRKFSSPLVTRIGWQ